MSLVDIDGALIQGYLDMSLGLFTIYEGEAKDPPEEADWAKVSIVPAASGPASNFEVGMDLHTGFLQVDFNTELGTGKATLLGYAQAMRDQFIAGKGFLRNSQYVRVVSCERTQTREVDGWLRISVTVNFEAITSRPEIV